MQMAMDKLDNPNHFDRVVYLIQKLNPACTNRDWAERCVIDCISGALRNAHYATGCCIAWRVNRHADGKDVNRVVIYFDPLIPTHVLMNIFGEEVVYDEANGTQLLSE